MSRNLSITEPRPSVPQGGYIGGGRGGAGNYARYQPSDLTPAPNAQGPPSYIRHSSTLYRQNQVSIGRGGAGNMYRPSFTAMDTEAERVFKFDEELFRQREAQTAPVYHIGRGGAGNSVNDTVPAYGRSTRAGSSSTCSENSTNSEDNDRNGVRRSVEGAFERLSRKLTQNR